MLIGPFELLELQDSQAATFRVLRWEESTTTIHPAHAAAGKVVPHLRVHVPRDDKPLGVDYWDLTSATLVAQMRPSLQQNAPGRVRYTIRAQGFGAKKRFSVETSPA